MKQKTCIKKAKLDVGSLQAIVLVIALVGLISSFTLQIMSDMKDNIGKKDCADRTDGWTGWDSATRMCYNATNSSQQVEVGTTQWNSSEAGIEAVGQIPEKLPIIVTVIVAAIIIGILVTYFGKSKTR